MFETANPSALSFQLSQMVTAITAKICHVTEHRDRFPASQDIGWVLLQFIFHRKGSSHLLVPDAEVSNDSFSESHSSRFYFKEILEFYSPPNFYLLHFTCMNQTQGH